MPLKKEILDEYIQGKSAPEGEEQILRWLDENDLEHYPNTLNDKQAKQKLYKNWRFLTDRIKELKVASHAKSDIVGQWMPKAAILVGIILLGGLTFIYLKKDIGFKKYETTYGEIKRINLADGTTVTLNARSVLKVKKDYNKNNRTVYLSGEAYFKVTHEAEMPFTVQINKLSVTALGTSFDVSGFSNDPEIKISLEEGKVLVKAAAQKRPQEIILKPGERAVYGRTDKLLQTEKFNPKIQLAWQQQIISFENASMGDVVRKIERFYGVTIDAHLIKSKQWHLTGEYKNQTLRGVLESLSFNYKIQYKIEGDKVVLY